ncbi:MAG: DegT/DnrJ/EryC1/StrS family aminotransferase [Cyanobacteriota bacterium]|nr:DegT/DnrJ/EryC1/StrS family aminotransferase [Cyanobacteriota bacterium]
MQVPPFSLSEQLKQLGDTLDQAVLEVLRGGQYIGGPAIGVFEQAFAAACGVPHAVGCNSGTDALILALRALGIGPGDQVITASFSFFATAEAISAVGATPVFVDVDPASYLIDLDQLETAITPATKALLPVHLFGRPVDMERLCAIASRHGLKVIEDCAQATGASWAGKPVGSWGDAGCFSFFPTKNLGGAGDGGAVTCKDPELARTVKELAVHGMPRRYLHTALGYNSRLDTLQAAVLNVKLPHLAHWVERRRTIAATYRQELSRLDGVAASTATAMATEMATATSGSGAPAIVLPEAGPEGHSWNQFVLRVPSCPTGAKACQSSGGTTGGGISSCTPSSDSAAYGLPEACCRDWLKQQLADAGVTTIIYYPIPIHRQPAYAHLGYGPGSLPVTERLCSEVLSLPIFPELSSEQQSQVIHVLSQLVGAGQPVAV